MHANCGSCLHWVARYEPTQFQLDDAPHGSLPVYRESSWGWCEAQKRGKWTGWPGHKIESDSEVETHNDGSCELHSGSPVFSDSPISPDE